MLHYSTNVRVHSAEFCTRARHFWLKQVACSNILTGFTFKVHLMIRAGKLGSRSPNCFGFKYKVHFSIKFNSNTVKEVNFAASFFFFFLNYCQFSGNLILQKFKIDRCCQCKIYNFTAI